MPEHKAGFIVFAGKPNCGKSTLLNSLLGFKLSIVSPKPQTTRQRILGIWSGPDFQACLLDTPGILAVANTDLERMLRSESTRAMREDADVVVYMIDAMAQDIATLEAPPIAAGAPLIVAINKVDIPAAQARLPTLEAACAEKLKPKKIFRISALKGEGVQEFKSELVGLLPVGEAFYDKGQISDRWEKFFAAEIIREKVFELYEQEVPHATAVVVEAFREPAKGPREIFATLFVETDGQKGIIIGAGGQGLKRIRERSEAALETFLKHEVKLELWVKVRKNWRKDPKSLNEFGYGA